jgi:uncharacterized protein (DUF2062 family)
MPISFEPAPTVARSPTPSKKASPAIPSRSPTHRAPPLPPEHPHRDRVWLSLSSIEKARLLQTGPQHNTDHAASLAEVPGAERLSPERHRPAQSGAPDAGVTLAVLIPTYDNAQTVGDVIRRSSQHTPIVIVVDDGSTDETRAVLADLRAQIAQLEVQTIAHNRGKGHALRVGFERARQRGATHVVTIDADGQHDPDDIPLLIAHTEKDPDAVILGVRERAIDGYPARCRIGRAIANGALFVQCSVRVSDSQCGMRVYPIGALEPFRFAANRYSYETELLVRAVWAGRRLIEMPIRCAYPADRVSHWRPWLDSVREFFVQCRLFAIGLVPRPVARLTGKDEKTGIGSRVRGWVSPLRLWRELRRGDAGPARTAAGVAVGVFIGASPLFGLHTVLSVYAAWRLRLHPIAVVLGSQVGMPPLAIPLAAISIQIGHLVLGRRDALRLPNESTDLWVWFTQIGLDWALGSVILGAALSVVAYGVVLFLCRPLGPGADEPSESSACNSDV